MPIRLDGFYVSKQPVDFGMPENDHPYSYLRFYNDGTVIQSDIPGIPPATTPYLFDRSSCGNKGQYQTDGHKFKCVFPVSAQSSGSGKASTVEKEGEIVGDELHVHHVSYINNVSYDEQYKFYKPPPSIRKTFLGFLVGEKSADEVLRKRQELRGERDLRDFRIRKVCFWLSSPILAVLFCLLFLNKRNAWFTSSYGTLDVFLPYILGGLFGLLAGLVIGVGLVANLLISYAHFIDMKLAFLKKNLQSAKESLSTETWDRTWKEYELHIDLYKYYLDMGLKANLFSILSRVVFLEFTYRSPQVG